MAKFVPELSMGSVQGIELRGRGDSYIVVRVTTNGSEMDLAFHCESELMNKAMTFLDLFPKHPDYVDTRSGYKYDGTPDEDFATRNSGFEEEHSNE